MNFLKEIIVIIAILIIVIFFEIFTTCRLEKSLNFLLSEITKIDDNIKSNETLKEISEMKEKWDDKDENLSLFVDHNELEKLDKNLELIEVNVNNQEYNEAKERIAEMKFMIEHIREKNALKWKNIF